jgi:hypothetical protein
MTDLECSVRDGEAVPVPLRGRTITARPELVSDPDEVQRLLTLMAAPIRLSTLRAHPNHTRLGAATLTSSPARSGTASASPAGTSSPTRIMP